VLRRSLHIICNSQATAQDISQFWGISEKKVTPIPLAYDCTHFYAQASPKPVYPPYFLYMGRPDPHKNLPRLLTAFAQIKNSDCQLWLAGSSDRRYTPLLQQQATALGIGDRVRFLDYVPYGDLPRLMSDAVGIVFPSLWEGFGFPVLEAMACGTPVITSNLSSLPEVVGEAGILVDPYNSLAIASAMTELLRNSLLRSQLREKGLQRATQFSWQKTGEATLAVLRSLI
jgi:glycosyltransferase involved in cell wall biosynthesis